MWFLLQRQGFLEEEDDRVEDEDSVAAADEILATVVLCLLLNLVSLLC